MAIFDLKMPKLGESITEGIIISWLVKPGDTVKEDDILLEISTAKVSAEIPSPVAGKITELLFKEGDTVPVGQVLAHIETGAAESVQAAPKEVAAVPQETVSVQKPEAAAQHVLASEEQGTGENAKDSKGAEEKIEQTTEETGRERWYSPAVLSLAGEMSLSKETLDSIPGTGYEGRLTKKDLTDYLAQKKPAEVAEGKEGGAPAGLQKPPAEKVQATPSAVPQQPAVPVSEGDQVKAMDFIRRVTAEHMVMSKRTSAHVTTVVEADVTKLVGWRSRVKDEFQQHEGIALTYLPAVVEAAAKALAEYPQVNASVDGHNILFRKHINIGVAVSVENWNLIVPVIHDADKLNLNGIAQQIDLLAKKTRNNQLKLDEIEGGTFTITNFGSFRNLFGTPIIDQPQVAILAVGYIEKKPAVVETPDGDSIAIRHKMYLSLSFDHRIVDGALGGQFLRRIADYLENWSL